MEARFRRPGIEGRSWRYGMLVTRVFKRVAAISEVEPISEVSIVDFKTGGVYVIKSEYVQVRVRGPRGGRKWQQL